MINHESQVWWFSEDGIVRWLQNQGVEVVSHRLDPLFSSTILNYDKLDLTYGYIHGHRPGWTVAEAGQAYPTLQLEFYHDLPEQPFALQRMPMRSFVTWESGASKLLLAGKNSGNKLLEAYNGLSDDGAAFTSFIQTGWHDFGWPNHQKYLRWMRILGRGDFTVDFKVDYQDQINKQRNISIPNTTDLWDTDDLFDTDQLWGEGSNSPIWEPIHPDVYGYQFSFRFTGNVAGQSARSIDVAGNEFLETIGQWGVNEIVLHALKMGDRV
jgi:hypothetical protein